MFVVVFEIIF